MQKKNLSFDKKHILYIMYWLTVSVADPERFDADLDSTFQADADPDPKFC